MFVHVTPEALASALLTLLLARHPAPVHAEDLARAFTGEDWEAAVAALAADGVVLREGRLHLVSRAAVRVSQLLE